MGFTLIDEIYDCRSSVLEIKNDKFNRRVLYAMINLKRFLSLRKQMSIIPPYI